MLQSRTSPLPFHIPANVVLRLSHAWSRAVTRRRDRRALAHLDPHLLRDIGLTPVEAQIEAVKPFWQP